MEILQFLNSLRRHWIALTVLALAAGSAGFLSSYLVDEKFEAKSVVLIRPEEKISISTSNDAASSSDSQKELLNFPIGFGDPTSEVPINTFIEIIGSRVMAVRVVEKLGMHIPGQKSPPITFMERVKEWLDPIKKDVRRYFKNIKNLFFYGRIFDPPSDYDEAIDLYIGSISIEPVRDTHLFEILFAGNTPNQAAAIANTAAVLFVEFVAQMNSSEYEILLEFLENQVVASSTKLQEAREALRRFKQQAGTISFEDETRESIRLIIELETDLEKARAELAGLLKTKLARDPDVVSLQAQMAQLEVTLEERNQRLNDRSATEAVLATLERKLDNTEESYQILRRELEEVRILQSRSISEMRVISNAIPPSLPAEPVRIFYGALALLIGLIAGVHVIILHELFMGTKIRSVDDVETALSLPVLATIPKMR